MNSVVDFGGEFYTNVYGDSQGALDSNDDVDYSNELVGVFVGPKECEMVSDFFQFQAFSRVFRSFHEFSQIIYFFQFQVFSWVFTNKISRINS